MIENGGDTDEGCDTCRWLRYQNYRREPVPSKTDDRDRREANALAPMLWHIMKEFSYYGFNEFIICAGYKQHVIKEWFADYYLHNSDITFDFTRGNEMVVHNNVSEPWKVTIVDTGIDTLTGGRIKKVQRYIGDEAFIVTYGDGVGNVDIPKLVEFHQENKQIGTITAYSVGQRFGVLDIEADGFVRSFREKNDMDGSKINIGYMVMGPEVFDYIAGDMTAFEQEPLENLAKDGQLNAYIHTDFWQCMDTKRDHMRLEELWASKKAPWKVW